jgi:FkbM family methyltransferase
MKKLILKAAAFAARILPESFQQGLYSFKPLAGFIRRLLNRSSPRGLVEVQVAGGDLAGSRVVLDMQVDKDYWLGTYEPDLQAAIRELVPPGAVVYDVGANIGYISLLLAKAVGKEGRIFSFEALPSNLEQLRRNIALNGLEERVTVVPDAVVDAEREVHFQVHSSGGMGKAAGSAGRQDPVTAEIIVPGTCLDAFVFTHHNPPPRVVKMDIEGGEVMAIPGMRRLLKEEHPLMLMELHGPESCRAAWEALTSSHYRLCWMRRGRPPIRSLDEMGWKAYVVALPEGWHA